MMWVAYAAGGLGLCPRHPRPGAFAPWNPNLMWPYGQGRARMLAGKPKPENANWHLNKTEAGAGAMLIAQTSLAGGGLGEPASVPPIGGAGAKRPAKDGDH